MAKSLRDALFGPLRGDYNSVRDRFFAPITDWLEYIFLYRLIGKSWIAFYADRLDRAEKRRRGPNDEESYEGQILRAESHLEYLRKQLLMPGHRLLDFGCGNMRSGISFMPFLGAGNYVGVDISKERLKVARKLAERHGLQTGSFTLYTTKDCELNELADERFDYVWAYAVLHHMPGSDIAVLLESLKRILNPEAKFFFSLIVSASGKTERKRLFNFYYIADDIEDICKKIGYRFQRMDDWVPERRGEAMFKLVAA